MAITMNPPNFIIRPMHRSELDRGLDWANSEGWNPGLSDADSFYAADPTGFLIGRLDDQPVAMISAVRYGQDFGFIGLYIAQPQYRGQGFGWSTWQAGIACLRGRTIGLDGVIAQQDNYRKSGFTLHHRNIRFEGRVAAANPLTCPPGTRIVPLSRIAFDQVKTYDRSFFPAGRSAFLARWISQPDSQSLALLQDDALVGYGVIRPCRTGYKIGPLFAPTEGHAEWLLVSLCAGLPVAEPFFLDVPECNPAAIRLAERHAMQPMFETARMYTGAAPEMALAQTFGITTFELG
jgi:hypothetical protein